jgi:sugar (pentulose or hexulose) kinase
MAEQLLVDAGLIGLPRGELRATLERRAAEAAAETLRYRPFESDADGAAFDGLSSTTAFPDLLRAIHQALGRAARDCYATLGLEPAEVRVADIGGAGPLAREALARCIGAPVRISRCDVPAASGAALVAAVALGHCRDLAAASAEWVEPRLIDLDAHERAQDAGAAPSDALPAPA